MTQEQWVLGYLLRGGLAVQVDQATADSWHFRVATPAVPPPGHGHLLHNAPYVRFDLRAFPATGRRRKGAA